MPPQCDDYDPFPGGDREPESTTGAATLPAPGSPAAPKYWMHETSQQLHAAVYLFVNEPDKLTVGAIALLRAYCLQWVESPVWDQNPSMDAAGRAELAALRVGARYTIHSASDLRRWLRDATAAGLDPL